MPPPSSPSSPGTLYVVATPIGNLEDITFRAVRILGEADLIASEDTRRTKKLLSHLGIRTSLFSYYRGREQERAAKLLEKLTAGLNIALVSDAGTPGISDPGGILVAAARAQGFAVVPVPGPSSLTAALSVAGRRENEFLFLGFPPARQKERRQLLRSVRNEPRPLVLFEAPHRLRACLADCRSELGDRDLFWAREVTKIHEELRQTTVEQLLAELHDRTPRGESVLIFSGAAGEKPPADADLEELIRWCRDEAGLSLRETAGRLSAELELSRSRIYRTALKIWQTEG